MSAFKYLSFVQLAETMNFMYGADLLRAVAKRRTSVLLAFLDFQRSERTPVVGLIARHTEQICSSTCRSILPPIWLRRTCWPSRLLTMRSVSWLRLKPCLLPLLCMRELIVPEMGVHLPSWPPVGFVLASFLRWF